MKSQLRCPVIRLFSFWFLGFLVFVDPAWADPPQGSDANAKPTGGDSQADTWKPLVGSWQPCEFGGDGPIEITDKLIKVGYGDPLTGVRWKGRVDREDYEIELEARRTDGFDFFCALTFPVGSSHCSLVLGGWGGGVLGISSIDGYDASDNATTQFRNFEDEKWHRVRVRVAADKIVCWINDKQVIDHPRGDHEFDIRYEMDPCTPLGLAAYECDAEYRNLRVRRLASHDSDDTSPAKQDSKPESP